MSKYTKSIVTILTLIAGALLELNVVSLDALKGIEAIVMGTASALGVTLLANKNYDGKW